MTTDDIISMLSVQTQREREREISNIKEMQILSDRRDKKQPQQQQKITCRNRSALLSLFLTMKVDSH